MVRGAGLLTQSIRVRRNTLGSSDLPDDESLGDQSMSEKRETLEGVYGAVLQGPRDMVKAKLLES